MTPRLVDFGYVEITLTEDCLLGPRGTEIRGHSFHTSRIDDGNAARQAAISHLHSYKTSYRLRFSLSGKEQPEGFTRNRVLASYAHLHFRANPSIVPHLIAQMHAAQRTKPTTQGAL
jgi:cobyrinic acid a,c-diamide synthase